MIGRLYYTVELQTQLRNGNRELVGDKIISVYEIANDKPKVFFTLEISIDKDVIVSIQDYLNDNGFGDREYIFKNL